MLFWVGGLLAALVADQGDRLAQAGGWVETRPIVVQVVLLVAAVAVVVGSGVLVQRLTLPFLRLVQGQWPRWLRPLARVLKGRKARRIARWNERWGELAARVQHGGGTRTTGNASTTSRHGCATGPRTSAI